jgi:hypothetical protein
VLCNARLSCAWFGLAVLLCAVLGGDAEQHCSDLLGTRRPFTGEVHPLEPTRQVYLMVGRGQGGRKRGVGMEGSTARVRRQRGKAAGRGGQGEA